MWDLGGQTSIRPYWRCYYPNTDAIIFVVDSCDTERLGNKQDSRGALNAQQVSERLGLPEIKSRQWSIQETSAVKGSGLFEGFDW